MTKQRKNKKPTKNCKQGIRHEAVIQSLYKSAPLPFVGQKRHFIMHFIRVLNDNIPDDGEGWTIVDAFGGSGLLSHVSKHTKPSAKVIYNDFDDYHIRLQHIESTNRLRRRLAIILDGSSRGKRLDSKTKSAVLDCLEGFTGFVDWAAVSTWVLFSGKSAASFEALQKMTLYNTIRRSDYPLADGYLDGLEVVKYDFEVLLQSHQNNAKCLFVLDPPYVCTQQGMYANKTYFGMVEFLRLMRLVRPPFIFFSSTRSEFVAYLDFIIKNQLDGNERVKDYHRIAIEASINATAKYEDNLVYKFDAEVSK